MRKSFLLSVILCFILAFGCAVQQNKHQPLNRHLEESPAHLSSPIIEFKNTPERIILNLTDTPHESQAVTWRTKANPLKPQAQIAPETGLADLDENSRTFDANTETVAIYHNRTVYHHSVLFQGLKPDTLYAYRVGDEKTWSEWSQFKTAAGTVKPFRFVYFGDPQEEVFSMCSRVFRIAYKKAADAGFWLFVGDLINNGDNDKEWAELFNAFGFIPEMTPMIFIPGNHEYPDKRFLGEKEYKLFDLWRPHFTLPENGPEGLKESVYFIDYQGVRFVMLNGNEKLEDQARWLDKVLPENPNEWTIAAIHQPFYSIGRRGNNTEYQRIFAPVFDKYSVDLVLQGHDHMYSRTYKLKKGVAVKANEKGTVYIVSVSGPKVYPIATPSENLMEKTGTGKQLFQIISIEKNRLQYESYDAKGELYDSFELRK